MFNFIFKSFYLFFKQPNLSWDIYFFSFLVILIPISLITGPAIPDIIVSVVGLYFLIISFYRKLWNYYKDVVVIGFLLFCLYLIFGAIISGNFHQSLNNEGSLFYFRYLFFSLAVCYFLDQKKYFNKCLLYISLICLFVVAFDGLFQYFVGFNLLGFEKYNSSRLTGFFGKEPIIGRYLGYLSIFTFFLIYKIYGLSKTAMVFSIIILVIAEVVIFMTGERTALFNISFFSILLIIFLPSLRLYRIFGALISILIISLLMQLNPAAKNRIINETLYEISSTKIPYMPYGELHERHYISALKMFKDKPAFGVGTNLFRNLCDEQKYNYKENSCTSHPHNMYIQLLAENGIFGFAFLLSFFLYLFYILSKQFLNLIIFNKTKIITFDKIMIFIILFVFWWPIIPHMSFYNNWNNVLIMLTLGYLLNYRSNIKNHKI